MQDYDSWKNTPFYTYKIGVTIQNPIRKTAANAAQVLLIEVTSPYKLCQMSLRMQAFDVHIVIICMALNSYKLVIQVYLICYRIAKRYLRAMSAGYDFA